MGLFKALEKLAELPVAVVADALTLGGSLNDKKEPYTATVAKQLMDQITEE